jgi:hypothetical protein
MIPNHEQQEFIKDKLLGRFKCRETYEELYDHVLTALEVVPDDVSFFDAVNNIIDNDLGGAKAIKSIENKYFKLAVKESIANYFTCIGQCLNSFWVLPIIVTTIAYYLLMQHEWFNSVIGQVIASFIILIPGGVVVVKKLRVHTILGWKSPKMGYARFGIRPFGNNLMLFLPIFLWTITSDICIRLQRAKIIASLDDYNGMPVNVATVLIFIILVHTVAYYKLYKDWNKEIIASFK